MMSAIMYVNRILRQNVIEVNNDRFGNYTE